MADSAETQPLMDPSVEEALRELEQRFRLTVEGVHDGLTIIEAGQVVFVNDRLCEILGYSKEELTRVSSLDLATPEEGDRLRRIMQEVLERGLPLDKLEFWAVRRDGTRCYIRNRYYTGHNGEGFPRRLVVTSDITEDKLAQQSLLQSLEHRSRQMRMSAEIGQDLASATSVDELYGRLVTLVREGLGYYHVQLFCYDPMLDAMVLVAGYGEVGEKMKATGHLLPYGRGVVGLSAATAAPVLLTDVARDLHWVPHPELPETRGELAVPIKLRGEVLAVLDVHSDTVDALTEEDQSVLIGLAGQTSAVIQSLRRLDGAPADSRHTQILQEITRNITARVRPFGDPKALARTVVRELGIALGRPVFIRLGSAEELACQTSQVSIDSKDLGPGDLPAGGGESYA